MVGHVPILCTLLLSSPDRLQFGAKTPALEAAAIDTPSCTRGAPKSHAAEPALRAAYSGWVSPSRTTPRFSPHSYTQTELEAILRAPGGHVVVPTSGSTGAPKLVVVSADALRASGEATFRALNGPGQWLLALPSSHIAGIQVLARSVLAGQTCVEMPEGHFSAQSFISAADQLTARTRYTSLVPTQLHRLLTNDQPTELRSQAVAALRTFDAILLGGAASSATLLRAASAAGIHVVTTYGMSETAGGCVYSGVPLDVARVRLDAESRIYLAGPMLADGYLATPVAEHDPHCVAQHDLSGLDAFVIDDDSVQWHRTNDLGTLSSEAGHLTVLGRADDVILSGGLNISPHTIESELGSEFGIDQAVVVGVPDPEWGSRVVAVVTRCAESEIAPLAQIRQTLTSRLGKGFAPRAVIEVDTLPHTSSGKPDRQAILALARTSQSQ